MESALDQKLDLSALHLGTISLGKLLGALLTLVICLIAVRLVTALLRRVLDKTHIDARVRKYLVQSVRLVLWVVTVLITADQLGIPVTSLVALLSVLSLAVSLAVQNVLANVAGGLVLLVTNRWMDQADRIAQLAEQERWDMAREAMDDLSADWESAQDFLHVVIHHETLDAAQVTLTRCRTLCRLRQGDDLLPELAQLRQQLQQLDELERLSLRNIL